jgi:hypothetical protein
VKTGGEDTGGIDSAVASTARGESHSNRPNTPSGWLGRCQQADTLKLCAGRKSCDRACDPIRVRLVRYKPRSRVDDLPRAQARDLQEHDDRIRFTAFCREQAHLRFGRGANGAGRGAGIGMTSLQNVPAEPQSNRARGTNDALAAGASQPIIAAVTAATMTPTTGRTALLLGTHFIALTPSCPGHGAGFSHLRSRVGPLAPHWGERGRAASTLEGG